MEIKVGGFFGLLVLIADIWAIVNVFGSTASTGAKVLWTVLILLLPVLGFIIWLFAGPRSCQSGLIRHAVRGTIRHRRRFIRDRQWSGGRCAHDGGCHALLGPDLSGGRLVAGLFGFGGIASASAGIAQILFFVFLVLLVISLIMYVVRGRGTPPPL